MQDDNAYLRHPIRGSMHREGSSGYAGTPDEAAHPLASAATAGGDLQIAAFSVGWHPIALMHCTGGGD